MRNSYEHNYDTIYRGIVESNKDPKGLGRCKVRVPALHGAMNYPTSVLPWARPIVLSPVNSKRGSVNIPDEGDVVWVVFEGSNRDYPLYIGGTYSTQDIKINDNIVDIYIENGNKISYDRESKIYTFSIGENSITLSESGITLAGNVSILGNLSVTGSIHSTGDISTPSNISAKYITAENIRN